MIATINELTVPGAIGVLPAGYTLTTKSIIINKNFFQLILIKLIITHKDLLFEV